MCSFLLVLLLFVVTFSTLQDSVTHWCPEEETAATKSGRQKSLVFAPHWLCAIDQTCTPTHQENPWETPLQGSAVSQNHPEAHHNGHSRPIPMEVHAVPTHQQKSCDPLRSLQSTLDNRCATSNGAQAADVSSHCVQRCMADNASLRLGTMGRVGSQRQVLELANASRWSSKSFSFTEHAQFAKSQRPKRKGIRQDQEERQSKNDRIPAIRRERCRKPQHIALRTAGSGDACLDKHRRIHWKQYAFCHNDLQSQYCRAACTEERMCSCTTCSISRWKHDPIRDKRPDRQDGQGHRKDRKGKQQVCYKKHPLRHEVSWEGAESLNRDLGSQESAQNQVDQTHHRGCDDLAGTTEGIPEATGIPSGSHHQSQGGYRTGEISNSDALINSFTGNAGINATHHTCDSRAGRWSHRSRQRGREAAGATSDSPSRLCSGPDQRVHNTHIRCGGSDHGRCRARQKETKIHGAVWWIYQIVISGGVHLVQRHGVHSAMNQVGVADAYVLPPSVCAASHFQLTEFDLHRFSHWRHSIQYEPNYLNPFEAVLSAWKLDWSVICDQFNDHYLHYQNFHQ